MSDVIARRGEIWIVNLGEPPRRHWAVVVSVDARNRSRFMDSVLVVPFGSKGSHGRFPPASTWETNGAKFSTLTRAPISRAASAAAPAGAVFPLTRS